MIAPTQSVIPKKDNRLDISTPEYKIWLKKFILIALDVHNTFQSPGNFTDDHNLGVGRGWWWY